VYAVRRSSRSSQFSPSRKTLDSGRTDSDVEWNATVTFPRTSCSPDKRCDTLCDHFRSMQSSKSRTTLDNGRTANSDAELDVAVDTPSSKGM
jgi:hypothetical protein